MNWRQYSIEVVTHCICAGADQNAAEIRVPSIRGQIRWWFRALGGSREEEKLLFGGVHGEAQRSNVIFRLKEPLVSTWARDLHDVVGQNQPQAYLIWPLRRQKRGMIPPGKTFVLQYAVRPALKDQPLISKMQASLEAWILLGSIGTRSRRGFGSISLPDATAQTGNTPEALREHVSKVLIQFDRPNLKVMLLSGAKQDADQALDFLGNWLKTFRAGSPRSGVKPSQWGRKDHDVALGKPGTLSRPVIGLPLTQRYAQQGLVETELDKANRWASPVHLKVLKWGNRFYPLAVIFPGMAMQAGTKVTLKTKGTGTQRDISVDHSLLRAMMSPGPDAFVLWDS